jgi:hypothetical protein
MQREPWTYSLIEMHEAAREIIGRLKDNEEFSEYEFRVDRVGRCSFSDGKMHHLIWLEARANRDNLDAVDVGLWLLEEMVELGFSQNQLCIMLNGAEMI